MLVRRLVQYLPKRQLCYISNADIETTKNAPQHTPIFSRDLMSFFTGEEHRGKYFRLLDMTFGSGSHTCYILDQFRNNGVQGTITVYASDCDQESYDLAWKIIQDRSYDNNMLIPIKSNFKDLDSKLEDKQVEPQTLSGILIDTGISALQYSDRTRGFCHLRDGNLDLRLDPYQGSPRASEVLQTIDEASLTRLLKAYGGLKSNAKHVTSAIFEARFMNYKFKTVRELHEVMKQAAKHAVKDHTETTDLKFVSELLMKTMVALRMFVNDELNQLDYAVRYLAVKYLKVGGVLAIITHNPAEEKVVGKCFKELSLESVDLDSELTEEQILALSNNWKVLHGDPPLALPMAEQILYPRLKEAKLFAAVREK